jgi:hypothetical protein
LLAAQDLASLLPRSDLEIQVLAVPFPAAHCCYVPVILELPAASLLAGVEDELELELYVYATSENGGIGAFASERLRIDVRKAPASLQRTGLKYYGHLDLVPGRYRLRLLARDAKSGRVGTASLALDVPTYGSEQGVLLPPLLIDDDSSWFLLRESVAQPAETVPYPFLFAGEPFVPAARLDAEPGTSVRVVVIRIGTPTVASPVGRIAGSGGEAVAEDVLLPLDSESVADGRIVRTLFRMYLPATVETGVYRLDVRCGGPCGDLEASAQFAVGNR